jgi:hypothetical protein
MECRLYNLFCRIHCHSSSLTEFKLLWCNDAAFVTHLTFWLSTIQLEMITQSDSEFLDTCNKLLCRLSRCH